MSAPTIRSLRMKNPDLFYRQDWFDREEFVDVALPDDAPVSSPSRLFNIGVAPPKVTTLFPLAVILVAVYCRHPFDPIWARYIWCHDTDAKNQRIYVGGVTEENGRRFEIHRHIHITPQFGVPSW